MWLLCFNISPLIIAYSKWWCTWHFVYQSFIISCYRLFYVLVHFTHFIQNYMEVHTQVTWIYLLRFSLSLNQGQLLLIHNLTSLRYHTYCYHHPSPHYFIFLQLSSDNPCVGNSYMALPLNPTTRYSTGYCFWYSTIGILSLKSLGCMLHHVLRVRLTICIHSISSQNC